MSTKPAIKIALTPEQKKQIEQQTRKPVRAVKLKLEALEERLTLASLN